MLASRRLLLNLAIPSKSSPNTESSVLNFLKFRRLQIEPRIFLTSLMTWTNSVRWILKPLPKRLSGRQYRLQNHRPQKQKNQFFYPIFKNIGWRWKLKRPTCPYSWACVLRNWSSETERGHRTVSAVLHSVHESLSGTHWRIARREEGTLSLTWQN